MTASSLRPFKPAHQVGRRHDIGELALARDCAICSSAAEQIVDHDIGAAGLVEARDHVRADEIRPRR